MSENKQPCHHPFTHQIRNKDKCHGFCLLCGALIYFNTSTDLKTSTTKYNDFFSFAKPIYLDKKTEVDPVDIFSTLIPLKPHNPSPPSEWYVKNRKKAITFLRKIIGIYKFTDSTFYLSLCYIDIIIFNLKDLANSKLELIVISCMLLAAKFIEYLNTEPDINRLIDLSCYYNEDDIIKYELFSLKKLEYRLNRIDPHELFKFLLNNGFIFTREIQHKPKEYISIIYCFAKKTFIDFLLNSASLSYDPVQICFSVIHLTRKHFGLKPQNFKAVRNIYAYHYSSYKDCLNAIKLTSGEGTMRLYLNSNIDNGNVNGNWIKSPVIKAVKSEGSRKLEKTITRQKQMSLVLSKSFCYSRNKLLPYLMQKEEENSSKEIGAKLNKSCKQLLTKTTLNQLITLVAY